MPRVAALEIGQSPRPDLVAEALAVLPSGVELVEFGALDGVDPAVIPPVGRMAANPLITRLANDRRIVVDEAWVAPHLQAAARAAEAAGADALLLLCAGGFEGLTTDRPLIRPADVVAQTLRRDRVRTALVVVPSPGQLAASEGKWRRHGIDPVMLAATLSDDIDAIVAAARTADAVVLDFVGHPSELVDRLEAALAAATGATLHDLGRAGARALRAAVEDGSRTEVSA